MRSKILSLFAAVALLAACAQDSQQDGGSSGSGATTANTPKATAAPKKKVASKPAPGSKEEFVAEVGDRVFFGVDQSDLNPDAQSTLDRQAAWLKKYPSVRVAVEGHCDERGTREYNLALGERRASAVRDYLVARGIDPSRLSTISYGKERPVAFPSNEEAWAQNRRSVTSVN
ncbi:MAG: peptidoglycan-associated lipoprotein [Rhodospirillaceae bacterium]|nr:peptidoglycan-associated lipoprotein [Rhodospirillaceae bacterium]